MSKIRLASKIWVWFFLVQVGLRRYPLPRLVQKLRPTSAKTERIPPRLLGDIVTRVLHIGRFRARCLDGALVHYRLLAEQGDRGQLVIGLHPQASNKDAHAWVELAGVDVGPPPGRGVHVPLARYP